MISLSLFLQPASIKERSSSILQRLPQRFQRPWATDRLILAPRYILICKTNLPYSDNDDTYEIEHSFL